MNRRSLNYAVIVGCGRLGSYLAEKLSGMGTGVVIIDCDSRSFGLLSPEFSGFTLEGDAADFEVLRRAKTEKADIFIAVSESDNLNLMTAQTAKRILGVRKVMARVFDPEKEAFFRSLDVETLSPTVAAADLFLRRTGREVSL